EMVRSALEKERSLAGNKTLALRLLLEGSCPVHAELHAQSLQISEEIRGIAASLESIWLEKIKFRTSHNLNREELTGGNNPLSELLAAVDKLDSDASVLTTLTHNLANLKAKLPAELIDETFSPESRPHKSGELQSEVKELLIAKLIQLGGAT
ncbi:DNA repair exonuclease, partial [bacterium]|nr:DNA repair exonuclease [bacterium]